jgi:nitrogenase molybdenum-iron protein beta chain
MPQSALKIKDHADLFNEPEYQALIKAKREQFECPHPESKVAEVIEWTKSWEYREKNLERSQVVINPAKACQPLGAVFAASGFDGTLSFVHGSQGCVAYYRSHLARHFKEPSSAVSSSMTEDAAVFGGLNNLIEGLANAYALYKPKMIAVSTTCMAEVIGDDLNAFIQNAKKAGSVPLDFDVPFAHTPAFVGSHTTGYDNMMKGILTHFWEGQTRAETNSINIIPGFDGFSVGNLRELKRILDLMGVDYTILSDTSDVYDTPSDGEFRMFSGGTSLEATRAALNAKATLSLQADCTTKTLEYAASKGQAVFSFNYPVGVSATDALLVKISELTGRPVPEALRQERGRLVDAYADSMNYLHGKSFAVYGDPDFVTSMARFLTELGAEPVHLLATNGSKAWAKALEAEMAASPYGQQAKVWAGKDLWHLRSLLFTEPAEFLIGNSYGKYLEKDTGIPLIRLTFPIFDRHHHHRFPTLGYQGGLQVFVKVLDKILDELDVKTAKTGISYDLTR